MEEVKAPPVLTRAYMMAQGANSMQYRMFELSLEDGIVVDQKEIGVPDLKVIVLGRLLRLLVRM